MAEIKAIETIYNGYRFRSRLEARWAVFFDSAGIEYQYEPEGFELVDGSHYLPDFYLPKIKGRSGPVYVEAKGVRTFADMQKISLFSNMGCGPAYREYGDYKGKPIYVVNNVPKSWDDMKDEFDKSGIYYSFEFIDGDNYGAFFYKFKNGDIGLCGPDNLTSDELWGDVWGGFEWFTPHLLKARQARFEHGEEPRLNNTPSSNKPEEVKKQDRKPITVWDIREKARQAEVKSGAKG